MAQKSGFFNALNVNGVYDRTYNANDYTDNLAVIISNGVLRSDADDLKVTASGMIPSVAVGRAWIKGHYYYNDAIYSFPAVSAPAGGTRYDRIVLRFNNNVDSRNISLVYLQGTAAATPQKPAITRTANVFDLVLADIYVGTNATNLTITDTRADKNVCGWVYSTSGDGSFFTTLDNDFNTWFAQTKDTLASVTIYKRYVWKKTLTVATTSVQFNIPQYDGTGVTYVEVYVNGILRATPEHYSLSGNVITFTNTIVAGSAVTVYVYKSIDGTGIDSVADEITELQNTVATIKSAAAFNYNCTNSNDNISLSQIAQALYSGSYTAADVSDAAAAFLESIGGNTYLAALPTDCNITINVIGKLGVSTPFAGDGTTLNRYKWFSLGVEASGTKKIVFDFAKCERMLIWATGNTDNIVFYGTDLQIRNANVWARCNTSGCAIQMIAGRYSYGSIDVSDCKLRINTTGVAKIAENGNFTNCYCYVSSSDVHALCFVPTTDSIIRLIGGTYYAYTASANEGNISAVFYTYSTATNGVIMAYNINCPTAAVTAFYQKYLSVAFAGKTYINGVVSTLNSNGNYNEIVGQVKINKR